MDTLNILSEIRNQIRGYYCSFYQSEPETITLIDNDFDRSMTIVQ